MITGEVGAGKTVSVRTVLAGLDASRHTIIYLPNPMIGVRGLHETIVATLRRHVVPNMLKVREFADKLEGLVADDLWPLPTYQEMLFIK